MKTTFLETRDVPLEQLRTFPGNAKQGNIPAIRESLRQSAQYKSLVVWQEDNGQLTVLIGNNTLEAMRLEKFTVARCEIVSCDPGTARRVNLSDNRTAELGTWDEKALASLLDSARNDQELLGTGYADIDVEAILKSSDLYGDAAKGFLADFADPPPPPPAAPPAGGQPAPGAPAGAQPAQAAGHHGGTTEGGLPNQAGGEEPAPIAAGYVPVTYTVTIEDRTIIVAVLKEAQTRYGLATLAESLVAVAHDWAKAREVVL